MSMLRSPNRFHPLSHSRRCVVAIVWVYAAVPETKGRTLEEIEALLMKGYNAPNSDATAGLLQNNSA